MFCFIIVIFFDGVPIDTPQGVTARAADEAEEQQKEEGRHSYIFIRGLFAFCCLRCCSSLAGAVCPRCSGSPTCLVAAAILLSRFTQDARGLLVGVNVGGAGTLVASLASLITFREYTRRVPDGGKSFFLLFSGISFAFLAILLTAMSVLGW